MTLSPDDKRARRMLIAACAETERAKLDEAASLQAPPDRSRLWDVDTMGTKELLTDLSRRRSDGDRAPRRRGQRRRR